MRISDIVTPQEFLQIFEQEYQDLKKLGKRDDLIDEYIIRLSERISKDYRMIIAVFGARHRGGMLHLLSLLDRFLEEKYDSNKPTN
jgi:hypothetical protein